MTVQNQNSYERLKEVGACAMASIRDMVAALECDYERLEELRTERDNFTFDRDENAAPDGPGYGNDIEAWKGENPDDAEELAALEEAAGECESRDDAMERIQEDPLEIQVRSDWHTIGDASNDTEFYILLTTGGPAVRIMGELQDGEPRRAYLQTQDWGTPWTDYYKEGASETLMTYVRCFYFGE